jgi:MFS family permease
VHLCRVSCLAYHHIMVDTAPESATAVPPSPLSVPIFRSVWIASLASNFGGLVQSVGAAWLMTSLSDSPQFVALVQASAALPIMVFSLLAGAMADNLDRRVVMLWAQGFMFLVSVALAILAWFNLLSPWTLLVSTFLVGCGTALNNPAWQASVGDMVPRAILPRAVALNSLGFNIARSVGPAVGGLVVAVAGAAGAFLVNAISYVGLVTVLARWRPDFPPRLLPRERMGTAMLAGLRYVAMSPKIKTLLFRALFFAVAASAVPALLPLVARDLVTGGPLTYGILLGAFGTGAVAGALVTARLRVVLSTEWIVRMAAGALTIGAVGTATSPTMLITIPALLLTGIGWVVALTTFNISVQLSAPRWVVARALALYQMSVFGGLAAGSWLFGLIAEDFGVAVALIVAAGVQALGVLIGLIMPLPQIEDLNLDPLNRWKEPAIAVAIEPRSGPVVITVEYRIAEANIPAFLHAMNERRRIVLRDGGKRWTLLRDLGEAELWIERYHVPTWLDYIRNSQRRTQADAEIIERIGALLSPGHPQRVRRMVERQTTSLPSSQDVAPHSPVDPLTDPTRTM